MTSPVTSTSDLRNHTIESPAVAAGVWMISTGSPFENRT
jgi:hypothetical protein